MCKLINGTPSIGLGYDKVISVQAFGGAWRERNQGARGTTTLNNRYEHELPLSVGPSRAVHCSISFQPHSNQGLANISLPNKTMMPSATRSFPPGAAPDLRSPRPKHLGRGKKAFCLKFSLNSTVRTGLTCPHGCGWPHSSIGR